MPERAVAPRPAVSRRSAPPRRPWRRRAALAVVVVAALLAAVVLATRPSGHGRAVALPAPGAVPSTYHVVYRLTAGGRSSYEDLWVNRPFEADDVIRAGRSADAKVISTSTTRLGRQLLHAGGGQAGVMEMPPQVTPLDVRLDAVLDAGVRSHAVRVRGVEQVAGRRCQVYRTRQSLSAVDLTAVPTASDHVDTCIDAQGIVLAEHGVAGGDPIRDRVAVAVHTGRTATGHRFVTTGTHIPLDMGGGRIVSVTADSRPPGTPFWQLPAPPSGFRLAGRFAVVPPAPTVGKKRGSDATVTEMADVYVKGPDVIVIEQGQAETDGAFNPPSVGQPVDLGPLGTGTLSLSARASSVSALTKGHRYFVRVSGTLPPDRLQSIARRLAPLAPGTLVTIPDLTSDGA